jgi:hypothetical protein
MVEVTSLFSVITKAKSLTKFVESGKLSEAILGDIALSSAKNSLSNACLTQHSENYKNQVWNAIGHLELSLTANKIVVSSYRKSISQSIGLSMSVAKAYEAHASEGKIYYISCVMAICYTYLKEPDLRDKYLSIAYEIVNSRKSFFAKHGALTTSIAVGKMLMIGVIEYSFLGEPGPFYEFWHENGSIDLIKKTDKLKTYLYQQSVT